MINVGFIGVGNMGAALARAVSKAGGASVLVYDSNAPLANGVAVELGARVASLKEIAENADFIFLGVKPNVVLSVVKELNSFKLKPACTVVSMAAGVEISSIAAGFSGEVPIIRIMPNMPVGVGQGMILWCANKRGEESANAFLTVMAAAGTLDKISEHLIDAASAVSGCGPAFAFMFIEALADGGVKCGLPREKAQLYAAEMLRGSASMLLASNKHPGALKDAVCSPGGSTIAGVKTLEDAAFRSAVASSVESAFKRTQELGK